MIGPFLLAQATAGGVNGCPRCLSLNKDPASRAGASSPAMRPPFIGLAYEQGPLLKPSRTALRNLGPGNKRKIGFVCQRMARVKAGGLNLERPRVKVDFGMCKCEIKGLIWCDISKS